VRLPQAADEVAAYVVAAAVRAPSVHNTQPWQCTAECGEITVRADACVSYLGLLPMVRTVLRAESRPTG